MKKFIFFVVLLSVVPTLAYLTDVNLRRTNWSFYPHLINLVIPGLIVWTIFVFILFYLKSTKRKHLMPFTFWGIICGFLVQQIIWMPYTLPVYQSFFSHPSVDGPIEANLFGALVDSWNYFFSLVFGIIGGIIDGIRYYRRRKQKHPFA